MQRHNNKRVCFAVSRPGSHIPCGVIPKVFKKWYSQLPYLSGQHGRDGVENKPASSTVVSLGKALDGMPSSFCGRAKAV